MDMLEFIKSRRSTRKYLHKPVEPEKLNQIIQAGCYAPSGKNNQSWHFVVMEDPAVLSQLAELVQQVFSTMTYDETTYGSLANSIRLSKRGNYVFHYNAPALIVVTNVRGYGNAMADSSCALENMMLMANALDLGSCWINQLHWLDENPEIRAFLARFGVTDEETICGALAVGYADTADGLPERTPLPRKEIRITRV